jgi:hypothetical protein
LDVRVKKFVSRLKMVALDFLQVVIEMGLPRSIALILADPRKREDQGLGFQ